MRTKRIIFLLFSLSALLPVSAQQKPVEGTTYFLPKTAVRFALLVEKTTFEPGEYARYAERYMKLPVREEAETSYRIVGCTMSLFALPDTAKEFKAIIDSKHTIITLERDENGILKAINHKGIEMDKPAEFMAAPRQKTADPHSFMTEEMLSAASSAKTAELIAREIYDIRDSRNMLSRGEADFMPKDGEQLRLMLHQLQTQEQALLQVFAGTTTTDTTEHVLTYIPTREVKDEVFFRFSKRLGLLDSDDLGGEPYYINVRDLKVIPTLRYEFEEPAKRTKEDIGINVCLPGKIQLTLKGGNQTLAAYELMAAQFGRVENLSANLFGKKFTTRLVLNPVTGNVEKIQTEPLQ